MNGELRAKIATRYLLDGRPEDAQRLLDETPLGIDHALLHVVEGRLHLVNADRMRDGTGETDATLLSVAISAFEGALKTESRTWSCLVGYGTHESLNE